MQRELTDDEKGLVATAIRHGPFPPKPDYLPQCHRLYERGWFDLRLSDEQVLFELSNSGFTALELGVPLGEAWEAMN